MKTFLIIFAVIIVLLYLMRNGAIMHSILKPLGLGRDLSNSRPVNDLAIALYGQSDEKKKEMIDTFITPFKNDPKMLKDAKTIANLALLKALKLEQIEQNLQSN